MSGTLALSVEGRGQLFDKAHWEDSTVMVVGLRPLRAILSLQQTSHVTLAYGFLEASLLSYYLPRILEKGSLSLMRGLSEVGNSSPRLFSLALAEPASCW